MPGPHHIFIIEKNGEYLVRPAVAVVHYIIDKGQLGIRNLTGSSATLYFPPNVLAGSNSVTVEPDGGVFVDLYSEAYGIYSYSVLISKDREVVAARGESGPSLIIDR